MVSSECKTTENMNTETKEALEAARHELVTLHGLVAADGEAPMETFKIDTSDAVQKIDKAIESS